MHFVKKIIEFLSFDESNNIFSFYCVLKSPLKLSQKLHRCPKPKKKQPNRLNSTIGNCLRVRRSMLSVSLSCVNFCIHLGITERHKKAPQNGFFSQEMEFGQRGGSEVIVIAPNHHCHWPRILDAARLEQLKCEEQKNQSCDELSLTVVVSDSDSVGCLVFFKYCL